MYFTGILLSWRLYRNVNLYTTSFLKLLRKRVTIVRFYHDSLFYYWMHFTQTCETSITQKWMTSVLLLLLLLLLLYCLVVILVIVVFCLVILSYLHEYAEKTMRTRMLYIQQFDMHAVCLSIYFTFTILHSG